jgi:hypothetical protein
MLDHLVPALRAALARLERLPPPSASSPLAELELATQLHAQAALLSAIAHELAARTHDDLGRFGAQVVASAARASDAEAAACEVAEAFLGLTSDQKFAVTPPRTRRPSTDPPKSWKRS